MGDTSLLKWINPLTSVPRGNDQDDDADRKQPRSLAASNSRQCYRALRSEGVIGRQAAKLLDEYRRSPNGLTDAELAARLCLPRSTISARRNDLNQSYVAWCDSVGRSATHLIITTGERRANPGVNSRQGTVFMLKDYARWL